MLALAAVAPAAMLAVDPDGWYPFGPSKWLVIPTLLLAGAALVLRDRPIRAPRSVGRVLVALVAWMALAVALGRDHLYAWIGTPERHFGALTWALCALALAVGCSLDPLRQGRTLVTGLLVAGFGVGAVSTAEALGWEPRLLDVADRLSGPFGSPAYLGAATALLLPVAVAVALDPRVRWRIVGGLVTVLLGVACLGSGARAAWVGLAAAALLVAAARGQALLCVVRANPRRAVIGGSGLIVVVVAVFVLTPVGSRLSSVTDPDAAGGRGRLDEWRVAAHVAEHHLLAGVGPEGYRTEFARGVDARYERTHGRRQQPDRAHSGPLDITLAGGLPALGRVARPRRPGGTVGVAVAAVRAGLAAGGRRRADRPPRRPAAPLPGRRARAGRLAAGRAGAGRRADWPRSPKRAVPGPAVAVLGLAAAVALASGATDVVADRRAEVAAEALGRGDHRAAAAAATSAEELRPDIVRLHLLAARATVADEQGIFTGLRHVDDALAVSPHDPIALLTKATLLVDRAESTLSTGHISAATTYVRRLLADDPDDAALWRLAARMATLTGDSEVAREAGRRATALTPPEERR